MADEAVKAVSARRGASGKEGGREERRTRSGSHGESHAACETGARQPEALCTNRAAPATTTRSRNNNSSSDSNTTTNSSNTTKIITDSNNAINHSNGSIRSSSSKVQRRKRQHSTASSARKSAAHVLVSGITPKKECEEEEDDNDEPDCSSDEVSFSSVLTGGVRKRAHVGARCHVDSSSQHAKCETRPDSTAACASLPAPCPDIYEEPTALPRDLQLLPEKREGGGGAGRKGGERGASVYAQELEGSYHWNQTVTADGIVSESRERRWQFGPYSPPAPGAAGVCRIHKRLRMGPEESAQTLAQYLSRNPDLSAAEGRLVGVKSNNLNLGERAERRGDVGARKLEGFLRVGKRGEGQGGREREEEIQVQTAEHGLLNLTMFCAFNLVLPEDPMDEIVLLDRCVGEGGGEERGERGGGGGGGGKAQSSKKREPATVGFEWYPKLSEAERKERPGHDKLFVCCAPMCGLAFADLHFCKAHQIAAKHGSWEGETPIPKFGRVWMQVVDCTTSGSIVFHNPSVERKMRKFVIQSRSSEEARISESFALACKVMHTGDKGKGWGLFAARDIRSGEFIGHYAGTIVDVGYSKRYTGHYTFGLIHGLAIDGTGGGALRFMNHAMQDQEPTVHALIVNHFGVCHVAVYARRDIESGEEMTLRYTDATDADFFATACGLD